MATGFLATLADAGRTFTGRAKTLNAIRKEDDYRLISKGDAGPCRLPVIYGNDDYFLTRNHCWTALRVPSKSNGFLSDQARKNYYAAALRFWSKDMPHEKENAGQISVINRVVSMDEWETQILDPKSPYNPAGLTSGYQAYVRRARASVDAASFSESNTYVFVRNGSRGGQGLAKFATSAANALFAGAGMDDAQPDKKEIDFWRPQAQNLRSSMKSTWLAAEKVPRRELEWVIRHQDTPGLPTPDVSPSDAQAWGAGAWRNTLSSYTEEVNLGVINKKRYRGIRVDGPTGTGTSYVAFLPIAVIPQAVRYDSNWLNYASSLDFPVDINMHYEVIASADVERDLDKIVETAEAQEAEASEAGVQDTTTTMQRQSLDEARTQMTMNRSPMVYWQAVMSTYADDPQTLLNQISTLIQHYNAIQFELECPPMDQRELYFQSFPGADVTIADWFHRTDTQFLAASQPWLDQTIGNSVAVPGDYQGFTLEIDSAGNLMQGHPFFFNLFSIVDFQGKAPTEGVIASPGAGKTVSRGLKPVHEDALRGVTQYIWDPKGDFLPLYNHARDLMLDPAKVRLIDLGDPTVSISLDAYSIAEVDPEHQIDERENSAREVLRMLAQEVASGDSADARTARRAIDLAVARVLEADASGGPTATMQRTLDVLRGWKAEENLPAFRSDTKKDDFLDAVEALLDQFSAVERDPMGRLLFRDPTGSTGTLKVEEGVLTIFVAMKLKTTDPGAEQTPTTVVGDTIAAMMTDYIRSLLSRLPVKVQKSATFDEWHVIKRTKRADALVDWMRRMGRSRRCAVRQMSQSANDLSASSLACVWAGWAEEESEAAASCRLLGIEETTANIQTILNLSKGEFIFRDGYKRYARVFVDFWDRTVLDLFNTEAISKRED